MPNVATYVCFHWEACHYFIKTVWHLWKSQIYIEIITEQYNIHWVKYARTLINYIKIFTLAVVMRSSLPLILSSSVGVNL